MRGDRAILREDEVAFRPRATIELLNTGNIIGSVCAILTPAIKAKLKELETGDILLVRTDDPASQLDVRAWCALTGNVLLATTVDANGTLNLFLQKESTR